MKKIVYRCCDYQLIFAMVLLTTFCLGRWTIAQEATGVVEPADAVESADVTDVIEPVETPDATDPAVEEETPAPTSDESTPDESSVEEPTEEAETPSAEEPTAEEPIESEEPTVEVAAEEGPVEEEADEAGVTESDATEEEVDEAAAEGIDYAGLVERAPDFFAVTHPAVVHFPIALLMFGAFFVVVGWVIPSWGQQIPIACLLFGTLAGIVATLSGWWYADLIGYGDWQEVEWEDGFFQHRWLGVVISAASIFLSMIAIYAARTESRTAGFLWKFGLLLIAVAVAYEGHLGGALIHSTSIEEAFVEWINPSE